MEVDVDPSFSNLYTAWKIIPWVPTDTEKAKRILLSEKFVEGVDECAVFGIAWCTVLFIWVIVLRVVELIREAIVVFRNEPAGWLRFVEH